MFIPAGDWQKTQASYNKRRRCRETAPGARGTHPGCREIAYARSWTSPETHRAGSGKPEANWMLPVREHQRHGEHSGRVSGYQCGPGGGSTREVTAGCGCEKRSTRGTEGLILSGKRGGVKWTFNLSGTCTCIHIHITVCILDSVVCVCVCRCTWCTRNENLTKEKSTIFKGSKISTF